MVNPWNGVGEFRFSLHNQFGYRDDEEREWEERFTMTNQKLIRTTIALALTAGLGTAVAAQPVTDTGGSPENSTFGREEYSPSK
jgi:hypothetical protein